MRLDLDANLRSLVSRKYAEARASQHLIFSKTELAVIRTRRNTAVSNLVPTSITLVRTSSSYLLKFQLRYCPALAKKPTASNQSDTATSKPKDPFENVAEELFLAEFPRNDVSHVLVLNKYPVIAHHFILATKRTKPQTDVLELDDLDATYSCLRAWRNGDAVRSLSRLFAFFNSGEHSGASQAHRHLQFLPVDEMSGMQPQAGWVLLIDRMNEKVPGNPDLLQDTSLPFCHYATKIPPEPSPQQLLQTYLMLYHSAVNAVEDIKGKVAGAGEISPALDVKGEAAISYNLAITEELMAICPRRAEAAKVPSETADGLVAINGTILAGTLMVKDEGEWHSLQEDGSLLDGVLTSVGVPSTEGLKDSTVNTNTSRRSNQSW